MIFEDEVEILKRGQAELQKAIDDYSNLDDVKAPSSASALSKKEMPPAESKQLRQNEEDGLKTGDNTEDDHGKKFISDDDDFFEPPAQEKKKRKAMMEAQREIHQDDDSYEEYTCYDGSTATMDTYDDEYKESTFADEEAGYEAEFTDYTYDASTTLY